MKAIVTGGAGFIGSHLADYLVERGDEVIIIDNLSTGRIENVNPQAEFFDCDITEYRALKRIFRYARRHGFNCVFHLAALPKVQYSFEYPFTTNEANLDGTMNIIDLSAQFNIKRLIYSSSSSVYGGQTQLPLREDMPVDPLSPYAIQKFAAEKHCRFLSGVAASNGGKYPLTISLRYFNVYGPRQPGSGDYSAVISTFLRNAADKKQSVIYGDGEQTRDFTHVSDVVLANVLAARFLIKGKGGEVINIGAGKNYSVKEIAKIVGGDYKEGPARLEPRHTLADISKARELLGWEPRVSLEDGISDLKKWYEK